MADDHTVFEALRALREHLEASDLKKSFAALENAEDVAWSEINGSSKMKHCGGKLASATGRKTAFAELLPSD